MSEGRKNLVDLTTWQTAQSLTPMAKSAEELEYAHEAERLADHEIDQTFAAALRQPSAHHHELTGDALALSQKVNQMEAVVQDDQAQLKKLADNGGSGPNADDIEILKAQLGLDQSVLADTQQQLELAAGDERSLIQQELAAHEASMAKYDKERASVGERAVETVERNTTLAHRIEAWIAQNSRDKLIQEAMGLAQADATRIQKDYETVKAQVDADARIEPVRPVDMATEGGVDRVTRLAKLREKGDARQLLMIDGDRVETEKQLASVYGRWSGQVELQHTILLHLILGSIALITAILIGVLLGTGFVRHWMGNPTLDQRRARTLKNIFEVGIQLVGLVLILLVVFGVPTQIPTILGLATAGLTVALQDFILAFFGWFVLMGKSGVRLGDSVEINGVSGEVIEVGLFRTTLIETSNSVEKGYPTGRRVAFLNKYAINGQYFNFSTTGQWMWDEISVNIPESENTSARIEAIERAVIEKTELDARMAEAEWKRSSNVHGLSQFKAMAQVNLRPASSGVNLLIRYVTRASGRSEARNRVFQSVIEVLHQTEAAKLDEVKPM